MDADSLFYGLLLVNHSPIRSFALLCALISYRFSIPSHVMLTVGRRRVVGWVAAELEIKRWNSLFSLEVLGLAICGALM